jgi:hypothetical protein
VDEVERGTLIGSSSPRRDNQAVNSLYSSGAAKLFDRGLFPLPKVSVWTLFGPPFQIYNVLRRTRAINALRSALIFGTGIKAVTHDVVLIIVPTIVLFIIGVVALFRTRPRAQKYLKRLFRFFRSFPSSANGKVFRVKQARIDRGH